MTTRSKELPYLTIAPRAAKFVRKVRNNVSIFTGFLTGRNVRMIVLTSFHAQILQLRVKSMKLHVANKRGEIELFHMTAVSPLTGQIYIPENSHHFRRPITEILTRCLLVLIDVIGEMLVRMSIEFLQILQTHLTISSPLTLQIVLEFDQFRHVAFHPLFVVMI